MNNVLFKQGIKNKETCAHVCVQCKILLLVFSRVSATENISDWCLLCQYNVHTRICYVQEYRRILYFFGYVKDILSLVKYKTHVRVCARTNDIKINFLF